MSQDLGLASEIAKRCQLLSCARATRLFKGCEVSEISMPARQCLLAYSWRTYGDGLVELNECRKYCDNVQLKKLVAVTR